MKEKEEERLINLKQMEKELYQKGFQTIAGIDEAGRGPLAGPVVVAGVIMPKDSMIEGVNDSKKVSEKKREKLYDLILEEAISYSVAVIGQDCIDDINILQATFLAMKRAFMALSEKPAAALVDGNQHPKNFPVLTQTVIKGDSLSYSIAAASIIAKVTRDRYMAELAKKYPYFGFEKNAGYGTKAHLAGLKSYGAIEGVHRFSFNPVPNFAKK